MAPWVGGKVFVIEKACWGGEDYGTDMTQRLKSSEKLGVVLYSRGQVIEADN